MKKIIFLLALLLVTIATTAQVSKNRLKTTSYGWAQRIVPNAAYLDSTFSSFWMPTGNSIATNTNFIGTTTNRSLLFRTNNVQRFKIDSLGYVYNKGVGGDIDNTVFGDLAGGQTFAGSVEGTTLYGYKVGNKITTAIANSMFGTYTGQNLTTGGNNTLLGYNIYSATSNSTGIGNTVIGYNNSVGTGQCNYNTIIGASITGTASLLNNIILADGQGNIKYRWDGTKNNIIGTMSVSSTASVNGLSSKSGTVNFDVDNTGKTITFSEWAGNGTYASYGWGIGTGNGLLGLPATVYIRSSNAFLEQSGSSPFGIYGYYGIKIFSSTTASPALNVGTGLVGSSALHQARFTKGTGTVDIGEHSAGIGSIWISQNTPNTTNYFAIGESSSLNAINGSSVLDLRAGGNTYMRLQANTSNFTGSVGINQSVQSANLHVNGTGSISSTFTVNGTLTTNSGATIGGNTLIGGKATVTGGLVISTQVSNAATLSLANSKTHYAFNGTTTTWTLPTISGNTGHIFYLKNRGSGSITLNDNSGGSEIYNAAAVSGITIDPGVSVVLINDGTYWNVFN